MFSVFLVEVALQKWLKEMASNTTPKRMPVAVGSSDGQVAHASEPTTEQRTHHSNAESNGQASRPTNPELWAAHEMIEEVVARFGDAPELQTKIAVLTRNAALPCPIPKAVILGMLERALDRAIPELPDRCTDAGNGQLFAAQHRRTTKHVKPWRGWLVWSGKNWIKDDLRRQRRRRSEDAQLGGRV
jgi:hypothetical protein